MSNDRSARLWLLLVMVAGLAAIWTIVVILSGGFVLRIGSVRILSSRGARNPAIIAALSALAAWVWFGSRHFRTLWRPRRVAARLWSTLEMCFGVLMRVGRELPSQTAPVIAAAASFAVVIVALTRGALVAGGQDSYGYVSEADYMTRGIMRVEQPFARDMNWPFSAETLTPLGYRPGRGRTIVPIYPPGLPMLMALFQLAAGRRAVFFVVPLMGGVAVWATYVMGRRLAGRTVGAMAAMLLASSPTFLIQLMVPMSDVPTTAWWAIAFGLGLAHSRGAALASGAAVGLAILTRPNLAPLAVIPAALLLWRPISERRIDARDVERGLLFAAGVIAACIALAVINARVYGSLTTSGYGPLASGVFSWRHVPPNLLRYPRWLLETQTPVVLLAPFALFVGGNSTAKNRSIAQTRSVVIAWGCFIAAVFGCYMFYFPFETWFWLRFVLPAFPPLFVLTSVALVGLLARLERGARVLTTGVILAALAWRGVAFGLEHAVFDFREGERKYVAVSEYIARVLPERGAYLSTLYSGSIRYYSGRVTVRYDQLPPNWLDAVIMELRRLGYHPYIVLETAEEPEFRRRFEGRSPLAALDWPPVARMNHSSGVRIYDPIDREAAPERRSKTELIP